MNYKKILKSENQHNGRDSEKLEGVLKTKKVVLFIRNVNKKTKPKLKAIAKANGFSTMNNFLDYFAEKEFESIPEKFKEGLFL